ncbi:CBN-CYE-1 protein [Caenorhabditis brenneri]|uniref:CBN-CYE-1 protein n=1 Tax=Caenorhabditis brenneri TaxID=135651 RepID=G0MFY7_CAEBE|nr:CBN-CYE-1 protein [Caenorhabditis brenneri]
MDNSPEWTSDYGEDLHKKDNSTILLSHEEFSESTPDTTMETKENISDSSTESYQLGYRKRGSGQKRSSGKRLSEENDTTFNGSSLGHLAESEKSYEVITGEEMEEDYDEEDSDYRIDDVDLEQSSDRSSDGPEEDQEVVIDPELLKLPLKNETIEMAKRLMNSDNMIPAPPLLTGPKCQGIGSPTKVWSLMVKKDDIPRATRFLLDQHPDMTVPMRQTLLVWMMDVCEAEKLHRETFHLAVDYVDRYLESAMEEVHAGNFQLIGTAALFIAAKYEEIYPPKCAEFAYYTSGMFDSENVRQMEILMVKGIDWNFGPITCIQWLSTYLQLLGTGEEDNDSKGNMYIPKLLRFQFIEMCQILDYLLFEIDSFRFSYRTIAAAVLFVHYGIINDVEKATGFKKDQIQEVIEYVEPVCRVFRKREELTIIPYFEGIEPEDLHNIQVSMKLEEIKLLVEEE